MNIKITGRNITVSDNLKDFAEKRTLKLETYFNQLVDAHIVLYIEKNDQAADVVVNGDGVQFHSREKSADLYASLDLVFEKIERQIVKYKEKHQEHKGTGEKQGIEEYRDTEKSIEYTQIGNKPIDRIEAFLQMKNDGTEYMLFKKGVNSVDSAVDYSNKNYAVMYKNGSEYRLLAIPFEKIKEQNFENDVFIEYVLNVIDESPAHPNIEFNRVDKPSLNLYPFESAIEKARSMTSPYLIFFNTDSQYFNIVKKTGDRLEVFVPAF